MEEVRPPQLTPDVHSERATNVTLEMVLKEQVLDDKPCERDDLWPLVIMRLSLSAEPRSQDQDHLHRWAGLLERGDVRKAAGCRSECPAPELLAR